MRRTYLPTSLLLGLVLCACAGTPASGARAMVSTQLYFGLAKPNGTVVTAEQYQDFLDTFITERFPDGLTAIQARGQWRDVATKRVVKEDSRVLVLVHDGGQAAEARIREIAAAYKRRFEQDAVLRVDTAARVTF